MNGSSNWSTRSPTRLKEPDAIAPMIPYRRAGSPRPRLELVDLGQADIVIGAQAAQAPVSDFSRANEFYRQGHYAQAAHAYQALIDQESGLAALHYNKERGR